MLSKEDNGSYLWYLCLIVVELKDIRKSYKWSLLFWIDLLAILPIEIFATIQTMDDDSWHLFAFLRLNRLLKAVRVS